MPPSLKFSTWDGRLNSSVSACFSLIGSKGVPAIDKISHTVLKPKLWAQWCLRCGWIRVFEGGLGSADSVCRSLQDPWHLMMSGGLASLGSWPAGHQRVSKSLHGQLIRMPQGFEIAGSSAALVFWGAITSLEFRKRRTYQVVLSWII